MEAAKKKVSSMEEEPRIIATSPATADICDKLDLELVGICSSTISTLPDRYDEVETVGTAMSPDMEIVASLDPDWILSPSSLQGDLQPKYEGNRYRLGVPESEECAGNVPIHPGAGGNLRA